jgi:FtsH-binding integral membrane protein
MSHISVLWLPILVSAVAVFVLSSVIHMFSPWHKGDYRKVPNEDALRSAVGPLAIPPGDYMVPRPASSGDMRSEEFKDKVRAGPNLVMTVLPNGQFSMTRNLVLWFLYLVVVGIFAAWVSRTAMDANAPQRGIFHYAVVTAFSGYVLALWQMTIWYRRSLSTTIKATVDGLIYALVTAAIFVWLWPR